MSHPRIGHGKSTVGNSGVFDSISGYHGSLKIGAATGTDLHIDNFDADTIDAKYVNVSGGGPSTLIVTGDSTLTGAVTVNTGPVLFNTTVQGDPPMAATDFATKSYVDNLFGSGMLFLDAVKTFWDLSTGEPPGSVDGNRVIQTVTAGGYTINWIYLRAGGVWGSIPENPPLSGYSLAVTDPPSQGQYIYNAVTASWQPFILDHNVLLNRGTIIHTRIDSHISNPLSADAHIWLGQDVRTSAAPSFSDVTITASSAAIRHYDSQSTIATFLGAGPTVIATWTPQPAASSASWQVELRAEAASTALAGTATIRKFYLITSNGAAATAAELDSTTHLTGNLNVLGVDADLVPVGATITVSVTGAAAVTSSWASRISAVGVQLP